MWRWDKWAKSSEQFTGSELLFFFDYQIGHYTWTCTYSCQWHWRTSIMSPDVTPRDVIRSMINIRSDEQASNGTTSFDDARDMSFEVKEPSFDGVEDVHDVECHSVPSQVMYIRDLLERWTWDCMTWTNIPRAFHLSVIVSVV